MTLPRLYAIVDVGLLWHRDISLQGFVEELAAAGVELVQLRYKGGHPREVLRAATTVRGAFAGTPCRLILNDRADLAVLAGFDGVHLGQEDLSPEDARRVVGSERWIGLSTHSDGQVQAAEASCADYVAIGPVFATGTKLDAAPVVGLEGVRRARALTPKPLVAIGDITLQNARSVLDAGANAVAMISGLVVDGRTVRSIARELRLD